MSKKVNDNQLLVAALKNGTAIDHIPAEQLFKVASLLGIEKIQTPVTIGNNLNSKKMGKKGIIKISDRFFEQNEINRISLIAPNVNLNVIHDYKVVEKKKVSLPDKLDNIVRCNNPKCISNNEPMQTKFDVIDKEKVTLKCHYCGTVIEKKDIRLL